MYIIFCANIYPFFVQECVYLYFSALKEKLQQIFGPIYHQKVSKQWPIVDLPSNLRRQQKKKLTKNRISFQWKRLEMWRYCNVIIVMNKDMLLWNLNYNVILYGIFCLFCNSTSTTNLWKSDDIAMETSRFTDLNISLHTHTW